MITVNLTQNEVFMTLEVEGHADYNPGNDIVCSAVSALAMAFAGAVRSANKLVDLKADSGDFRAEAEVTSETQTMLNTILIGLLQVEKSYPEHVKVNLKASNGFCK